MYHMKHSFVEVIDVVFGLLYFHRHNLDFRLDQDCGWHYIPQDTYTTGGKTIRPRARARE